jgi:hypothetical protein
MVRASPATRHFIRMAVIQLSAMLALTFAVLIVLAFTLDALQLPEAPEPTTSTASTTASTTTSTTASTTTSTPTTPTTSTTSTASTTTSTFCDPAPSWNYAAILAEATLDLSAALDSEGNPFLAWCNTSNRVVAAFYDGAEWATEIPDGRSVSLLPNPISAANVGGLPAIAYGLESAVSLVFAQRDGSGWNVTDLEPGGSTPSLAEGPDGQPRVAHVVGSTDVRLLTRNASLVWSGETVYTSSLVAIYSSFLAYGAGLPAVAAVESDLSGTQRTALHLYDGASWSASEIENATTDAVDYFPTAAVYAGGSWSVAYEVPSSTVSLLKYATLAGSGSWTIETIANSTAQNFRPSASVACTGAVRLAFFSRPPASPPLAVVISGSNGSWVEEFSHAYPSGSYSASGCSQAVDPGRTTVFWGVSGAGNATVSEAYTASS